MILSTEGDGTMDHIYSKDGLYIPHVKQNLTPWHHGFQCAYKTGGLCFVFVFFFRRKQGENLQESMFGKKYLDIAPKTGPIKGKFRASNSASNGACC